MRKQIDADFQIEKKDFRKRQVRQALFSRLRQGRDNINAFTALKSGSLQKVIMPEQGRGRKAVGKKRRGRPRLEGQIREPNGRISRSSCPPSLLALEARAFHSKLTIEQARDPRAETYLGRLAILGRSDGLSPEQYEAAQQFLQLRNTYQRAILSPGAYYEATGHRLRAENMKEYNAWVKRVKKRYNIMLRAVQEAQLDNGHENLYAALQYVLIDGQKLPYLLGALRLLLNALYRHFKLGDKEQKKSSWLDKHNIGLAGFGIGF